MLSDVEFVRRIGNISFRDRVKNANAPHMSHNEIAKLICLSKNQILNVVKIIIIVSLHAQHLLLTKIIMAFV